MRGGGVVALSMVLCLACESRADAREVSRSETYAKIGIVTGSLITFTALYLIADGAAREGDLNSRCVDMTCPRSETRHIEVAERETRIGLYGLLLGLTVLGTGIAIYHYAPPKRDVSLTISPVSLVGTF